MHQESGFHYHVGILSRDASRYTAHKKLRKAFEEFDGAQFHSKFHNGWGSILNYLTKQDKEPLVWGEYSLEQIIEIAEASRNHKKTNPQNKSWIGSVNAMIGTTCITMKF